MPVHEGIKSMIDKEKEIRKVFFLEQSKNGLNIVTKPIAPKSKDAVI